MAEQRTNEELAQQWQDGNHADEIILQLWENNKKLAGSMVRKRLSGLRGVEYDDGMQAAFLALYRALRYYERTRGNSFVTCYYNAVRSELALCCGTDTEKKKNDPIHSAVSTYLSAGDDDGKTLLDDLPDDSDDFGEVERIICREQLRPVLESAIHRLPYRYVIPMDALYLRGMSEEAVLLRYHITARRLHVIKKKSFELLGNDAELRQWIKDIGIP